MPDDAIWAALRAATKARCCRGNPCLVDAGQMQPPCCMPFHAKEAAATVAAFLRALPPAVRCDAASAWMISTGDTESLAAAVEEAARDG